MTDWTSAGAMLLAGVILGAVFLYSMKRRKAVDSDVELRDLEAKRDALVAELRATAEGSAERRRLERETANALRQLDVRKAKTGKKLGEAEQQPAVAADAVRWATIKGFVWGAASMAVLAGIGFWVMQKAEPKPEMTAQAQQPPPMQAPQQQADPQIQAMEAAVAKTPDNLGLRNQLARAYLERDNLMGVFQQTQYVLKKTPNDPQALTYQALVRMAMGQPDPARTMLEQAIKSDPKYLDAYVALAWSQTSAGKSAEAEATLKAAGEVHPEQKQRLAEVLVKMREQVKQRAEQPAGLPPNHPPVAAAAAAAAAAPTAAPAAADGVHVTLQLAPGVAAPPGGIIYVIARPAGVSAGPPAAVKRMPLGAFPLTFDLSSADSMMGQPLPAKIHLEARIDSDGDAMTRDPKDPTATADNVATGSSTTLTLH